MHITQNKLPQLVGKTFRSIWLGESKKDKFQALKFVDTKKVEYFYNLESDCCSETFFSKEEDMKYILNNEIKEVTEFGGLSTDLGNKSRQGYDQEYNLIFRCKLGCSDYGNYGRIVYINSSNGYYGGNIEFLCDSNFVHPYLKIANYNWNLIISK